MHKTILLLNLKEGRTTLHELNELDLCFVAVFFQLFSGVDQKCALLNLKKSFIGDV